MLKWVREVSIRVLPENVIEVETFLHQQDEVVGYFKGEGSIIEITSEGREETNTKTFQVFVLGEEYEVETFCRSILKCGIIPSGRKWMVSYTNESFRIDITSEGWNKHLG